MSSEKRWMRFQPFTRLVPPLKMILSGAVVAMSRNASRNVVVLLNDCSAQSTVVEMLRRSEDCLLEVWVFKELHVSAVPLPASRGRVAVRQAGRSQIVKRD